MKNIVEQLVNEMGRNKSMELLDVLSTHKFTLEDSLCNIKNHGGDKDELVRLEYELTEFPTELHEELDKVISERW